MLTCSDIEQKSRTINRCREDCVLSQARVLSEWCTVVYWVHGHWSISNLGINEVFCIVRTHLKEFLTFQVIQSSGKQLKSHNGAGS